MHLKVMSFRQFTTNIWILLTIISCLTACDPTLQCLTCDAQPFGRQSCISCADGFGLTTTTPHGCEQCEDNCFNCVIGQNCTKCFPGFGPDPTSSTQCQPCMDVNCLSCLTDITVCDVCRSPNYFFKSNGTCGACADHCTVYKCRINGVSQCDRCDPGFGLTQFNTCGPCAPNCNNSVGCNATGTCSKCNAGYGLYPNGTCGPCDPNCNNATGCNFAGTCIKCNLGYELKPDDTCGPCSSSCLAGCKPTYDIQCDQCNTGYGKTINETFALCPDVCTAGCNITGARKCDERNPGYEITPSSGACTPVWLSIGLGIGVSCLVIIIILVVVLFVLYNKIRNLKEEINTLMARRKLSTTKTTNQFQSNQTTLTTENALDYLELDERYQNQSAPYDQIEHYEQVDDAMTETTHYQQPLSINTLSTEEYDMHIDSTA